MNKPIMTATLAVFGLPGLARAQVVADRPDFVEAAAVVGAGNFQVETSFAFSRDNSTGSDFDTWSTPTLFRIGVSDMVELRIESDWYSRFEFMGLTNDGFSDVAVGVKIATSSAEPLSGKPSTAVLLHADLPTGSSGFSGSGVRPSVRLVGEWELPGNVGFGVMPGILHGNSGSDRFFAGILGVVVSKGWTEQFRTFAEIAFEQIASDTNGGVVSNFDFGGTLALSQKVQMDLASSIGLSDGAGDFGITVGLSALFGN